MTTLIDRTRPAPKAPPAPPAAAPSSGCSVKPAIEAKPKTVSVNGVTISRAAIARETQNHPADRPIDAWQAAARALAIRELLLQEARRLGLAASPIADAEGRRETEEEALIRQLVESQVVTPEPDDAVCRRYYDNNPARFRSATLHEVSHILIPVRGGEGGEEEARTQAMALLSALRGDPSAFEAMARLHSACPSRETGGSLGQIGPGQTVPEFEAALPALPVGRVAPEPVRSRYGLHLVRVARRIEGRLLPFEFAAPRIRDYLEDRVRRTAERQYIALLAGRAAIAGVTLDAANSPLVQ